VFDEREDQFNRVGGLPMYSTGTTSFEERAVAAVSRHNPGRRGVSESNAPDDRGVCGARSTEKGWQALSVLDDAGRRDVLRQLFDPIKGHWIHDLPRADRLERTTAWTATAWNETGGDI